MNNPASSPHLCIGRSARLTGRARESIPVVALCLIGLMLDLQTEIVTVMLCLSVLVNLRVPVLPTQVKGILQDLVRVPRA